MGRFKLDTLGLFSHTPRRHGVQGLSFIPLLPNMRVLSHPLTVGIKGKAKPCEWQMLAFFLLSIAFLSECAI